MLPLPPPLFKYAKHEYSKRLVGRGEIRIGTLIDFRNTERYGPGIGDKEEGKKTRYDNPPVAIGSTHSPSADTLSSFAKQVIHMGPDSEFTFVQCTFSQTEQSPNCWIYSTSLRLSARVMRSTDSAYDSCVRIDYVQEFFEAIRDELIGRKLVIDAGIVPVTYRDRRQHYRADDGLHPAQLKAPKDSIQEEVRFVYSPTKSDTIEPQILTIPKLRDFCEFVEEIPE